MKRMRVLRARRRVLLLALAFALAACVGDPSPTPQPTSTTAAAARTATPTKTPTPTPTPRPTRTPRPSRPPATLPPAADPWPVPGSDPAATAAVVKAIDELRTLPAYRFEASVVGRSVLKIDTDNLLDTGATGWLTHTPETSVEGDFGTRIAENEWIFIYNHDVAGFNQRRVGMISEKLWDFQLRHLGMANVRFKWGAVDVKSEGLGEAVQAARDRMNQTRRSRKLPGADQSSSRLVVNA